jgi:hypothetical protein
MESITPTTADAFLRRFFRLCDGTIIQFVVEVSPAGIRRARLAIVVRDQHSPGVSTVILQGEDVQEMGFAMKGYAYLVTSSGIQFAWFDDLAWLGVDPASPLLSPDAFRKLHLYIAAKAWRWDVSPVDPSLLS